MWEVVDLLYGAQTTNKPDQLYLTGHGILLLYIARFKR
jgi:hypothetical protein